MHHFEAEVEAKKKEEADRVAKEEADTAKWEEQSLTNLARSKAEAAEAQWQKLTDEDDTKHIKEMAARFKGNAQVLNFTFQVAGGAKEIGLELGCLSEVHRREIDPAATPFVHVHRTKGEARAVGVHSWDILTAINGEKATGALVGDSVATVDTALKKASRPLTITFQRGRPPRSIDRDESACGSDCVVM